MIFLIDYDRARGVIITLREFNDAQRSQADDIRIELELELKKQRIEREVVLLDAASEADLRRTHRRYFEDLASLTISPAP